MDAYVELSEYYSEDLIHGGLSGEPFTVEHPPRSPDAVTLNLESVASLAEEYGARYDREVQHHERKNIAFFGGGVGTKIHDVVMLTVGAGGYQGLHSMVRALLPLIEKWLRGRSSRKARFKWQDGEVEITGPAAADQIKEIVRTLAGSSAAKTETGQQENPRGIPKVADKSAEAANAAKARKSKGTEPAKSSQKPKIAKAASPLLPPNARKSTKSHPVSEAGKSAKLPKGKK